MSIQRTRRIGRPHSIRGRAAEQRYWRIAGGVIGLAISGFILFTMLGGRRGITDKARELFDWESDAHHVPGVDLGERTGRETPAPH